MASTPNTIMHTGTTSDASQGTLSTMANVYVVAKMLIRALPYLVFEKFGQAYPLPTKSTKTAKFRRFESLDATPTELTEGVTPTAQTFTVTDIEATVHQYGNLVTMTDVLLDTNDSPVMEQVTQIVGEQAAETVENMRIGVLLGGTNVEYANGASRAEVNTPISLPLQRRITRKLKNQKARMITDSIKSTPRFYTESVAPCFVAVCHPDCEADIRSMPHFIDVKDYGNAGPWENEIGAVEGVRYLFTTLMKSWPDAGGNKTNAAGDTMVSTSGTKADVYPILFLAKDAYGLVPLKGAESLTPVIINPSHTESDPLAQRAHVAWKTMQTCVILNQAWMVRAEVAVTAY